MRFENLEEAKKEVEAAGDVLTVKVDALRMAYGAGKMGITVAKNISDELAGLGIQHSPNPFPTYSAELVRLYKSGSQIEKIIRASNDLGDDSDELLRQAAKGEDALTIRRIKELVCG